MRHVKREGEKRRRRGGEEEEEEEEEEGCSFSRFD